MAFLDHRELKIIKGFGPIPGDTLSAEQQPVVVNLMDPNGGIALDGTNGAWSPQIPSVKPLWAENPANDGRVLITGALNNVTETMRLIITGSDAATVTSNLRRLYDMRQDALDFWQTESQIEPVYLAWWANCGVGPQFALIYTMDVAPEFMNSEMPTIQVTLTIEREFGWRGIPPGANPKYWTLRNYQNQPVGQYSLFDRSVYHIANQTIQNQREWNTGQTLSITQNYIDVPGTSIPGDIPALLCLTVYPGAPVENVYIGTSSKPNTIPARTGAAHQVYYTLNAGDGSMGIDTSVAADTGAPRSNSSVTGQRTVTTFATATLQPRVFWRSTSKSRVDQNMMRGRFLVFLRARVSAAATVSLQLIAKMNPNETGTALPPVSISALGGGGAGNTTSWPLFYLGTVDIPNTERAAARADGLGYDSDALLSLELWASRSAGAGSLYMSDMIMIPVDEGATDIVSLNDTSAGQSYSYAILDNTGYLSHGRTDPSVITDAYIAYTRGQDLNLIPGVTNRIYFLGYAAAAGLAPIYTNIDALVNIVPRWAGIRDA